MNLRHMITLFVTILLVTACFQKIDNKKLEGNCICKENYRPKYHFTPDSMWMNDPNGMVYYEGEYHLFYQYYPDSTVWGPMHWGHAVSTDLMHWEHLPIGLYPDSLGWIFSGSAVIDWKNTSGFGSKENPPMIAIYTYHSQSIEKEGRNDFQYQGLAYSLDKGRNWTKYKGNPVLPNPGIRDFRDPKVMWYEERQKWIMSLAVKDHVSFYSSPDLKSWKHESDFGLNTGGHGGVWECPDLFKLKAENGTEKWVLLVSVNPGGPNGGSATQYFIGEFDGHEFRNENSTMDPIWLDYGKDNYAGVTWSDVPQKDGRRLFIGWMSNWQYATVVPTKKWRSATTLPRELSLVEKGGHYEMFGKPVKEFDSILVDKPTEKIENLELNDNVEEVFKGAVKGTVWYASYMVDITETKTFSIQLNNSLNENVGIKLDIEANRIEFDRNNAGKIDFSPEFAVPISGRYSFKQKNIKVELFWDASSLELFINEGQFQMTNLVFPKDNWNSMKLNSVGKAKVIEASYVSVNQVVNK
ncbi:glycoside hydrolase family 32 protein [Plebeiibacterium sediminum]|uniref:Glycoside hydrolase family 32 protein n=1 Tax=Plebeiibacterium sediminum TaxID=2992112 RepID=A0AAE3M5U8_9BACT|nr:glycoside hydrolase family 32 protein [Plebeiobacterium sediminum]MCW3787684.1 glycoside hydrolase family 32 protein [Plebeiobacterium sediminum]